MPTSRSGIGQRKLSPTWHWARLGVCWSVRSELPEVSRFSQFRFVFSNISACVLQSVQLFIFRCRLCSTSKVIFLVLMRSWYHHGRIQVRAV